MLYATFPDGARTEPAGFTRLIKLKAHQIEEIHWAKDHISKEEIQATARNTFELADNPGEQELIKLKAHQIEEIHWAKDHISLLERCATWTKEPDVLTVLNFLKEDPLTKIELKPDFEPSGIISFMVNERVIIDNPAVQTFWASINEPEDNGSQKMQCLVCGNVRPVLDRLQTKVKGIPGGQSAGTNIISANEDAYQSYGLHASLIAPTCSKCGEGFTKGLNRLLSSEKNRLTSGNTALIFWTKEEVEFDFLSALDDPDPLQVHALLQTVQTGQWADVDEGPCYALALSASGSRAVIRDWLETTIGNAKLHLSTWFQRQHITSQSDAMPRYYGLRALARATVREVRDLPASTPRSLAGNLDSP